MAGLWTEVCLAQTALSALKDGFEVYFVSDASGGVSKEAHEDAKARMLQAGARPVNWLGVVAEWTPDYTSAERNAVTDALLRHGGGRVPGGPVSLCSSIRRPRSHANVQVGAEKEENWYID